MVQRYNKKRYKQVYSQKILKKMLLYLVNYFKKTYKLSNRMVKMIKKYNINRRIFVCFSVIIAALID
ncbi:MAG: hypothetical protein Tp172MES593141_38 [Prokaryotic dsDNA virus sp.]|nr:MAG: hypothetical protein Tp172MES593141_38 [Prokaryotic dsDNA virus sp.]